MAFEVQDSDLFLVNRGGASYKVSASNLKSKVQNTDILLASRSGKSYKLTGQKLLNINFRDTDYFLVNRNDTSYKTLGTQVRDYLIGPRPKITNFTFAFDSKDSNHSFFKGVLTFDSSILKSQLFSILLYGYWNSLDPPPSTLAYGTHAPLALSEFQGTISVSTLMYEDKVPNNLRPLPINDNHTNRVVTQESSNVLSFLIAFRSTYPPSQYSTDKLPTSEVFGNSGTITNLSAVMLWNTGWLDSGSATDLGDYKSSVFPNGCWVA